MPKCSIAVPALVSNSRYFARRCSESNNLARHYPVDIFGNRPAQSAVANDHTTNLLIQDPWSDSAAACFDFGEFRHIDDQL